MGCYPHLRPPGKSWPFPNTTECEGNLRTIVYTCGALLRGRELIIPCAMSDSATSFATVPLDELLAAME